MKRKIVFSIGTLSECLRLKRIFQNEKIPISILKLEEHKTKNGCAYGIEFAEQDLYSVVYNLTTRGISYNTYYN